eukprot:TRINITY_DN3638_c0_g1_i6.p1 TRINITY_DN3638_c0_g1~~TRINITY_DN3638_c0_g1_i6.p1  ORF type:complete len:470 (+),score=75.34 TRINITY_DN3638_c0_g1_i6:227-1636(+)
MRRQPQDENSASRQDLEELEKMKKHIDTCLTRTFTVNDFYDLAKLINSEDLYDQHLGVIGLRKILAKKLDMPIQDVIDANLIPRLMSFMKQDEHVHLQLEAAWALTNVASGNSLQTKSIIEKGGIPLFVTLLKDRPLAISEQAIWALGNIAAESTNYRDDILEEGALDLLVEILAKNPPSGSGSKKLWSCGTWAVSNLCRGKPAPNIAKILVAMPILLRAVQEEKAPEVLSDAIWALVPISDRKDKIQDFLESGAVPDIVQNLSLPHLSVIIPTLRLIGNMLLGNSVQCEYIVNCGILIHFDILIEHKNSSIVREICWAISNLAASAPCIKSLLTEEELFRKTLEILDTGTNDLKRELLWAMRNIFKHSDPEDLDKVLRTQVLEILRSLLLSDSIDIICSTLEALYYLIQTSSFHLQGEKHNPVMDSLQSLGIIQSIENLQEHRSNDVYAKAYHIIKTFFAEEIEDSLI